jgi:hypothetical protein
MKNLVRINEINALITKHNAAIKKDATKKATLQPEIDELNAELIALQKPTNRLDLTVLRNTAKGKVAQFGFNDVTFVGYKFAGNTTDGEPILATKWTRGNETTKPREYAIGLDSEGVEYPLYEGTLQAIAMQLPNVPAISVQFENDIVNTLDISGITLNGGKIGGSPLIAVMA